MRWVTLEPIIQSEVRPHSFYSWEFSGRWLDPGRIPGEKGLPGHCWPALSGSTRSQSPPSARRISSGFRRGSSPGRTRKCSSVSARTTFISVMANVCPMQFLWAGVRPLTVLGTFIQAPSLLESSSQLPPPATEIQNANQAWDPQTGLNI